MNKNQSSYCFIHAKEKNISFIEKFIQQKDSVVNAENIFSNDSLQHSIQPIPEKKISQSLFTGHLLKPESINRIQSHIVSEDWIVVVLLSSVILATYIRFIFRKRLNQIFKSFLSERFVNQLNREGNLFSERISIPLFINYLLVFPLFFYMINKNLYPFIINAGIKLYIEIILFIFLMYISKIIFIRFTGFIFNTGKEATEHLLIIFIFNQIIGLILLPLLVFIIYSDFNPWLFYASIVFVLFVYIFRIFRIAFFGLSNSRFSKFYLFLYLCTVEILPLSILAKILIIKH